MTNKKFEVPNALINYAHLRTLAKDLVDSPADTPLTCKEIVLLAQVIVQEQRILNHPIGPARVTASVVDNMFGLRKLPRFTALEELLNPNFGYLAKQPYYLLRIARHLLDWNGTKSRDISRMDMRALKRHYPHLFLEEPS